MTRTHFIILIILSCMCLLSANGSSKLQIGNDLLNNLIRVVSQKLFVEVNKHKDNLPQLNLNISPTKFLPIKLNITNLKYDDLVYREDELQISVDDVSKKLQIKLSKNLFLFSLNQTK